MAGSPIAWSEIMSFLTWETFISSVYKDNKKPNQEDMGSALYSVTFAFLNEWVWLLKVDHLSGCFASDKPREQIALMCCKQCSVWIMFSGCVSVAFKLEWGSEGRWKKELRRALREYLWGRMNLNSLAYSEVLGVPSSCLSTLITPVEGTCKWIWLSSYSMSHSQPLE